MRWSEHLDVLGYRFLIRAYPRRFRVLFGTAMIDDFERMLLDDIDRHGRLVGRARAWARALGDIRRSLPTEWRTPTAPPHGMRPGRWFRQPSRPLRHAVDTVRVDLTVAVRSLRRRPIFAATAVLTLALGVGANAAIFSVIRAVLLRPLPYPESHRLIHATDGWEGHGRGTASFPEIARWRDGATALEGLAPYAGILAQITAPGPPERLLGGLATPDLLDVLRVRPIHGSWFMSPRTQGNQSETDVVLGYELWQRRFLGDPAVVGTRIELNREPMRVVGVMPDGFAFPAEAQLWISASADLLDSRSHVFDAVGRLAEGFQLEQAHEQLAAISSIADEEPRESETRHYPIVAALIDEIVGDVRLPLFMLLGAVGLVLLIACANVTNLVLAESMTRRREFTVRASLGAGRGRLTRQFLAEAAILGLGSIAIGLVAASAANGATALWGPNDVPRLDQTRIDATVLLFVGVIGLATAIGLGLGQAIYSTTARGMESLRAGRNSTESASSRRLRNVLVWAQVGLTVVLLIGAGLLLRSFVALQRVDLGFDPRGVLVVELFLPPQSYPSPESTQAFWMEVTERVRPISGVERLALTVGIPPVGGAARNTAVADHEPEDAQGIEIDVTRVSPGYFATLGIDLLAGRSLVEADVTGPRVAVVDERFARRLWPGQDPVGKRFFWRSERDGEPFEVIGVARSILHNGAEGENREIVYVPMHKRRELLAYLTIRTEGDPTLLIEPLQRAVWEVDDDISLDQVTTIASRLSDRAAPRRFNLMLVGVFAGIALTLAAVGVIGIVGYTVQQRVREIGVRMALGAEARHVVRLVGREAATILILGLASGLLAAFWLARFLQSLLFAIPPADPITYAGVAVVLFLVGGVATWLPITRAVSVDPVSVLRGD